MSYYLPPKTAPDGTLNELFNIMDWLPDENDALTLNEASKLFISKIGTDIVKSSLHFNNFITYSADIYVKNGKQINFYDIDNNMNTFISSEQVQTPQLNNLSAVTLSYLEGLTSSVQTQINSITITHDAAIDDLQAEDNNLQTQIDTAVSINNSQATNITALQAENINLQNQITSAVSINTNQDNSITNLQTATTNQSYANGITSIANDLQTNGLQSSKPNLISNLTQMAYGNCNSYLLVGSFSLDSSIDINIAITLYITRLITTSSYDHVYEAGLVIQIKKTSDNSIVYTSPDISPSNAEINTNNPIELQAINYLIPNDFISTNIITSYDIYISGSYATNASLTNPVNSSLLECFYNLNTSASSISLTVMQLTNVNNTVGILFTDNINSNNIINSGTISANSLILAESLTSTGNDFLLGDETMNSFQIKAQNSITLGNSGTEPATVVIQSKALATNIRNAVAGVWLYNGGGGSYDIYPIFYTTPHLNNHLNQAYSSGTAGFSKQDGNLSSAGEWTTSTLVNINDRFMVLPRFGIIGYANTSYGGNILLNYKNTTSNPVMVRGSSQNSIDSVKIFFNDALQEKFNIV